MTRVDGVLVRGLLLISIAQLSVSCAGEMSSIDRDTVEGTSLSVRSGEEVVLDGSVLFGVNGPATHKRWEQVGGPAIPISDPTADVLRFIAPDVVEPTFIYIALLAHHAHGSAQVLFTVTVLPVDSAGCGDGACAASESCTSCLADCGACPADPCGDGMCDSNEGCASCAADCGTCPGESCGNGACGSGEDCSSCAADCGVCPSDPCGDGTCGSGEDCSSCAVDCGTCDPTSHSACLERANVMVLDEIYTERVSISSPPQSLTVDARSALSLSIGQRALEIGRSDVGEDICVLGWTVIGQQARDLTWRQMHDDIGGSALRIYGSNYIIDGLRAENIQDGFDPRTGDGFVLQNAWMQYVRDDCIENDERMEGSVVDSLFDGCYTFFSEQEEGDTAGETLVLDHVLVRMESMPAPYGTSDTSILGHGSFFKKFDDGGRHEPIIRDSIFFLEDDCYSTCKDWPPGTTATNVTLVWTGSGEFPMSVLPGMTLTRDRSVWDAAVARWKQRHGCTTMDAPCTKLHDPDPY